MLARKIQHRIAKFTWKDFKKGVFYQGISAHQQWNSSHILWIQPVNTQEGLKANKMYCLLYGTIHMDAYNNWYNEGVLISRFIELPVQKIDYNRFDKASTGVVINEGNYTLEFKNEIS
jgi:hypothetical protein